MGKLPFDVVTSGLDQILFRADAPEDLKLKVIGKLVELGTAESNKFLKEVDKRMKKAGSPRLRTAVEQAVKSTMGGSQ